MSATKDNYPAEIFFHDCHLKTIYNKEDLAAFNKQLKEDAEKTVYPERHLEHMNDGIMIIPTSEIS